MKLLKSETVVRYCVSFTPLETKKLLAHPELSKLISTKGAEHNNKQNGRGQTRLYGLATLTKVQINAVCDELGINGREWFEKHHRFVSLT